MARSDGSAYNAACREAHAIVKGVIASILEGIKAGEVDEDSLSERIHEECDNALIYTSDQWVCAYGLRDEDDAIESGMCEPTTFDRVLAAQAFLNLRAAVSEHDFSEALAVAEDAAEGTTPEEPRDEGHDGALGIWLCPCSECFQLRSDMREVLPEVTP